jgi:hypothetical protein
MAFGKADAYAARAGVPLSERIKVCKETCALWLCRAEQRDASEAAASVDADD